MAKVRGALPLINKITMAKLKNEVKAPEVGVDTIQDTTEETDISSNTAPDAQTQTATTDVESTTITGTKMGTEVVSGDKTIAPKQSEKDKLSTQKRTEKSSEANPDNFTLEILKAYSNYESLYVNRKGGVFTPHTPESIRGSAVLYKNPYFKS